MGWFSKTAGSVLLLTGAAKVLSGLGHASVLAAPDPIFVLPFGKLMLAVGAAEVVIAVTCFSPKANQRLKLGLVAWLATSFLAYRFGLWAVGWHHPCGCMGSLAGALHLSDQAADSIMKVILAYLLVGSYAILLWEWRRAWGARSAPPACVAPA